MKKLSILAGAAALLITLTLTACSGGFVDPGYKEIGVGTGGSSSGDLGGLGSGGNVIDAKYRGTWEKDGDIVTINGNSASIAGEGSYRFDSHMTENGWDIYTVSSQGYEITVRLRLTESGQLEANGFGYYDGVYTKVNSSTDSGNRDSRLVGTWTGMSTAWTFNSNGSCFVDGYNWSLTWSTSGSRLTMTDESNNSASANYQVSGNTLTFTNSTHNNLPNGTYTRRN